LSSAAIFLKMLAEERFLEPVFIIFIEYFDVIGLLVREAKNLSAYTERSEIRRPTFVMSLKSKTTKRARINEC
jgi:hypothetical protein